MEMMGVGCWQLTVGGGNRGWIIGVRLGVEVADVIGLA